MPSDQSLMPAVTCEAMPRPTLHDGFTIVVKRDCATCEMVTPVVAELVRSAHAMVYTQDDPTFPTGVPAIHDDDLSVSWHHDIETVPTLLHVQDGVEIARTVGWNRDEWRALTNVADLGDDLPAFRPGCGSMSVDPDRATELEVRFGSGLSSRRIELASQEDDVESMFERGWSDGLPLVPPTEARVLRMLTGTSRRRNEIVAVVPPDLVPVTVEKVAINAVMAGCKPEYLPVVLAALAAACTDSFNMHGILATTMPVGPVLVVNGPIRQRIGMNSGVNVLGQGNRANATIGRALQLVIRNMGGGRPGEIDRAAHGQPGKLGFCFAEDEERSPFTPLSVQQGFEAGQDTVTLFAGEGPRCIVDQLSRTPESLANTLASCLRPVPHPKLLLAFDAILVLGPEHARVFADAGWERQQVLDEINARLIMHGADVVRGAGGIAEGIPESMENGDWPKFRPGGLMLVHAGGEAGLFSAVIGGWVNGATGSQPVTTSITDWL
jgi:hypothetical protein